MKNKLDITDEVRQAWMQLCAYKTEYDKQQQHAHNNYETQKQWVEFYCKQDEFAVVIRENYGTVVRVSWEGEGCSVYDSINLRSKHLKSVKYFREAEVVFTFYYDNPLVLT